MKISILTVHKNDLKALSDTLDSIQSILGNPDIDWIVIDGGTSAADAAQRNVITKVRGLASKFISEPDSGIYDAMNKGTGLAVGEYLLYLNAGDLLHPRFSLQKLKQCLVSSRPGMIWGVCHERYEDGQLVRVTNRSPTLAWYGIPVNHQNVFFRRDLLGACPYNEKLRYCADYDLISRLLKQGAEVHRTEMPFVIFQRGGSSAQNFRETMQEEELLRTMHFGVNPVFSRMITHFKLLNSKAGQFPVLRRLMRKWV